MLESDDKEILIEEEAKTQQIGLEDQFIRDIATLLSEGDHDKIRELCLDMPPADVSELISKQESSKRKEFIEVLGDQLDPDTFSYLDHEIIEDLLEHMPPRQIAAIVDKLDSDDALRLIEHLEEERHEDIMRHLNRKLRAVVKEGLTYPEYSAGRMMQREVVAIPQFWTVGKTIDYLRAAGRNLPEQFHNIFIVDPMHHFIGAMSLNKLLCSQRSVKIDTLVDEERVSVPVTMDQEHVAFLFQRKSLLSAPVLDENEQLIGVITVDDIVDVINEEAEEDLLHLSGVTDTDIFRPVLATANSRFFWLAINLGTAILASFVISFFESTIEQIAVLAVLMPIVASMGGNAGSQTLAVTVRALATKDLSDANAMRVIWKECMVGLINGILFAIIMGSVVYLWFSNAQLGIIIAASMIMNLLAAGLSGAAIPVLMQKLGQDPAQSAVVFLTTVTDILGFFTFLGLASWIML